ncbi:unnamed protein product [Adineta steineri]|uniref:Uncharacterized protein n=1 Tax=Adineta steineri TaxID=433720 RepID=A0A813PQY0_9BILA|nr:unnamed protein product [Adineta steineri]CAF0754099.1 unnamed protein product [Adineta steineri]
MHLSHTIFLICLLFTYSTSNNIRKNDYNQTMTSSRSIYDLVQIRLAARRLAGYHNRTHRNNHTDFFNGHNNYSYQSKSNSMYSKDNQQRFLLERLKVVVIISSIALGFMMLTVTICIVTRYFQNKNSIPNTTIVQQKPSNSFTQYKYSQPKDLTRNYSRKPRMSSTNV